MKRVFSLILCSMLLAPCSSLAASDDVITMSAECDDSGQWTLYVQLANPSTVYSGFQMDFVLPDGITLNTESVATAARTGNLKIQAAIAANGLPRVVCYSSSKKNNITGTTGTIFSVQLDVDNEVGSGTYNILAKNVRLTTAAGLDIVMPNVSCEMTIEDTPEYYTLTYWNGDHVYYVALLNEGDPIFPLDNLEEMEGYTFCGWGEVPEFMPARNLDVHATWCVNYYELKYIVEDMVAHTEQVAFGSRLPEFNPGDIEGYTFCGWNDAQETMPAHALELTAKYCVIYYNVDFIVDGEVVHTEQVAFGNQMPNFEAPFIDGYVFVGWEGPDYDTMPAQDVTYTAKYVKVGDVNLDGLVNTADVVAIYGYIINGDESGIERNIADVNADNNVNTADVTSVYHIITYGY